VSNPLYVTQQNKNNTDRDRFTGTFKGSYRMLNWLTADANVGYDVANQTSKAFSPLGFTSSSGIKNSGSLSEQTDNDRSYNVGATLTSVREFGSSIRNTSKVAWTYEDQTKAQLQRKAADVGIEGRSNMDKGELIRALRNH